MLPFIISLLVGGTLIASILNHARQEKRHKLVVKDYEAYIQTLVNSVMNLDVENYRLSIAAGEIDPEALHEPIHIEVLAPEVPTDPPNQGMRDFMLDFMDTLPTDNHGDGCQCRTCEPKLKLVEFSPTPFDDFDDLTVDDLEPHEEADLREFSGITDSSVTKLTEIMGVENIEHSYSDECTCQQCEDTFQRVLMDSVEKAASPQPENEA